MSLTNPSSTDNEVILRRVKREKQARLAAESILEQKSRELYQTNVELTAVAQDFQEQMENYRCIFQFAAQGILTVAHDQTIETFNPAAESIFLMSNQEAIGRRFLSLFADECHEQILQCFESPRTGPIEVKGLRSDGSSCEVEVVTSLVKRNEGLFLVVLIQDRTGRNVLETQLRHAQKMESVGRLAAGIAHEINTPVQFVGDNLRFLAGSFDDIEKLLALTSEPKPVSSSEFLAERQRLEQDLNLDFIRSEIPEAIEQSLSGIERVSSIVQAMKEFSHPGHEKSSSVDANDAVRSTITVSRNEWKYVANVQTDLDENLPLVDGYQGKLNQALLNIIVNSAHAIESRFQENSGLGEILVSTALKHDAVEIKISDDGCGIGKDNLARVFEPFFTGKAIGKGTGQGLSVAHSIIVDKHRGKIEVESELGIGTTFTILLPVVAAVHANAKDRTDEE